MGGIVDRVLSEGYEISAMNLFYLDLPTAEEFLEVYQGVIPAFNKYAKSMTEGPCIAMEVRQQNAVKSFRELCGPMDPSIGKTLRKESIRAIYGKNKDFNAVHCTDLEEDGPLESEYFFSILNSQ